MPSLFIPHHCFPPMTLWYSFHTSTYTSTTYTFTLSQLCLTFGEVALLPHTDLGSVDQVANRNRPPHSGADAWVTGAALVHLQQGKVRGGATCHRHHVVVNTIWREGLERKQMGRRQRILCVHTVFLAQVGIVAARLKPVTYPLHYVTLLQPDLIRGRGQQHRCHLQTSRLHLLSHSDKKTYSFIFQMTKASWYFRIVWNGNKKNKQTNKKTASACLSAWTVSERQAKVLNRRRLNLREAEPSLSIKKEEMTQLKQEVLQGDQ